MEGKKAMAIAKRTQEGNVCSYKLLLCLNIRVPCNCLQTATEETDGIWPSSFHRLKKESWC